MEYWFNQQLRQYRLQVVRAFNNFKVMTGYGGPSNTQELIKVPCRWGDPSRVAETVVRGNSENKVLSVPFITCYIESFSMSAERRQDPQLVDPAQIVLRKYDEENQRYTNVPGDRFTVERYMPVPYNLTMQVDVWTNNLDIKEQLLEQIATLFNPAIDLQTSNNPIDWSMLTYLEMTDIQWSSRTIPMGTDNPIDIFTMKFKLPILLNPPAKVKRQVLIQEIIADIVEGRKNPDNMEWTEYEFLARNITTPHDATLNVRHIAGNDYALYLCNEAGEQIDRRKHPTVTVASFKPDVNCGNDIISFYWNTIEIKIDSTDITQAINQIRSSLAGTALNCVLFNGDTIQFINTDAGDNTFVDIIPGSLAILGLQAATYPGGNLAWWRLIDLYGTLKPYALYGSNASQIRLKTVTDITQYNSDLIGWIDIDPIDQNKIIWHAEPAGLPSTTLPPINAIINPLTSGPDINLPVQAVGQRYLVTEIPAQQSAAWGNITAISNDIIEFNGNNWEVSWSPDLTSNITQYVKNNKSSKIFTYNYTDNEWSDVVYKIYRQGYWKLAL